jgi:hypothetical protein
MKNAMIIAILIAIAVIGYKVFHRSVRASLLHQVTEKYGDIPNLKEKTNDELKSMLQSAGGAS